MEFCEYPDRELLALDVANVLAGALENSLLKHEKVSFAVPGGSTPGPIFDALCGADLDWARVSVLMTDERWVPADHARSNAALVRARLLTSRASKANFEPYFRAGMTAHEAAPEVSQSLEGLLPLSVLLLGMGDDMHTASLFPGGGGTAAAMAPGAPAACAVVPQGALEPRVSLSAQVLDGALSKHLVIYGHEKRAAFEGALKLPALEAPIGAVVHGAVIHWAP